MFVGNTAPVFALSNNSSFCKKTSEYDNDILHFAIKDKNDDFELIDQETYYVNDEKIIQLTFRTSNEILVAQYCDGTVTVSDNQENLLVYAEVRYLKEELPIFNNGKIISKPRSLSTIMYDEWYDYGPYTPVVSYTPHFTTPNIGEFILAALIVAAFTGGSITIGSLAADALASVIASAVANGVTEYVKANFSYNKYCQIVRYEKLYRTYSNGTIRATGSAQLNWLADPWVYTDEYPYACRYLWSHL
jgi:hypothetical protein